MSAFDLREYMNRSCVCGLPRREHVHATLKGRLVVVAPHALDRCPGFMDAIELDLRGDPSQNPLLRPLLERSADAAGVELPPPPRTHDA